MFGFHNIRGGPNSVNLLWLVLLGIYTLLKLWLVADVELGKDEAVYWYWGQRLDASYALLPLAVFKLAHALYPHQEWFLRLPSALLGAFSIVLVYWLCRMQGLAERLALWAAAAFALSHWTWHTSSYLHPDGFLVPCWLLALCMARQAAATTALRLYICMGLAAGLAVLCKYSGAFLVGGLGLWIVLGQRGKKLSENPPWVALSRARDHIPSFPRKRESSGRGRNTRDGMRGFQTASKKRWHLLAAFLLPACAVAAPLIYAQFSTGFYLPQTLSTLSRLDDLGNPLSRLLFFAVSPLFFLSPFLLFLLYAGLVRAAKQRDLLALLPALCTIGAFLFFALSRGQIKGNWLLPGLLSLWPVVFAGQPRRWLLVAVVATGLLQSLAIGLGLKYPGVYSELVAHSGLDKSYVGLVSEEDQIREPSYSWSERLCEYSGWRHFAADVEEILPPLPLLSTQYSIPFALAYYGRVEREYYTVDDPRFRDLTDFYGQRKGVYPEGVLFAVRTGGKVPESLRATYPQWELSAEIDRRRAGCSSVSYQVFRLGR